MNTASNKFLNFIKNFISFLKVVILILIIPVYIGYVALVKYFVDDFLHLQGNIGGIDSALLLKIFLYPMLGLYIVYRIMRWSKKQKKEREEFKRLSTVSDATILDAIQSRHSTARPYGIFHLKIHTLPEIETYIEIPINLLSIPKKGDTIRVRYNPYNHDQLELEDGTPALSGKNVLSRLAMIRKLNR